MDIKTALPNDGARSAFLSSTRQEMYNALNLFYTHVQHTISLMFTILTVVFAVFGIVLREAGSSPQLLLILRSVGGLILSLLFPLGIVSILIIARYYKLYVAALIYAAELHKSVALNSHAWFEHIEKDLKSLGDDARKEDLIRKRTYGWPHSWILYSILIAILSVVGLIGGIILLSSSYRLPSI